MSDTRSSMWNVSSLEPSIYFLHHISKVTSMFPVSSPAFTSYTTSPRLHQCFQCRAQHILLTPHLQGYINVSSVEPTIYFLHHISKVTSMFPVSSPAFTSYTTSPRLHQCFQCRAQDYYTSYTTSPRLHQCFQCRAQHILLTPHLQGYINVSSVEPRIIILLTPHLQGYINVSSVEPSIYFLHHISKVTSMFPVSSPGLLYFLHHISKVTST